MSDPDPKVVSRGAEPEANNTPPEGGARPAVFRKPSPRELPSAYRAKPSPAEQGLKKMMDSIGSGFPICPI